MASPLIMSLEPRMLFDGAVAATVADAAQPESHATADPSADAAKTPASADHPATGSNANATAGTGDSHDQADAPLAATPNAVPGQTVVFVDSRVKDSAELLKDVAPGTQVVQLDATRDGLQQIADYLDQHQGVSSVQIIAHGNAGDLWLGNSYLSADNVAERSAVLAEIGKDMNVGGDILIYACNTAQGERGISFVDSLAALTGRDIAASTNRTGIGGDWTLEIATGSIESVNALSSQAMAGYDWGLATITVQNLNDSGGGSLRDALASAQNGDIVTFKDTLSGSTVGLDTLLEVSKSITLDGDLDNDGTADITLDGQYKTSVIKVDAGTTVVFDGLVITRGLSAATGGASGNALEANDALGAGISNFGDLTLRNVTVTANAASGGGGGGGVDGLSVGGGGGGGGGIGGKVGGAGGNAGAGGGPYSGAPGTANTGGNGGGYTVDDMGGRGGSAVGGVGGVGTFGYSDGGNGGTANNGTLSIGGGGGGSGWDGVGGTGGSAAGGIYNAAGAKLTVVGTSVISNNLGAGGGGGGGSGLNSNGLDGGAAGVGVGAIWNKGTVLITAANSLAMTGNVGVSGAGGKSSGGNLGAVVQGENGIYNDGGSSDTNYIPGPRSTVVVADNLLGVGQTSTVTITFTEAVTGLTNAHLSVANGTLSAVSSADGGLTWTATFTPDSGVTDTSNLITLDNTGVVNAGGDAGVGSSDSNNYAVDTVRPTATISVLTSTLNNTLTSTVNITFSEVVNGFTLADLSAADGSLSNLTTSDNIHFTATLTPNAGVESSGNVITLDNSHFTDSAGNASVDVVTSNSYTVDTVLPTATILVAEPALAAGSTSLVTITFSEAVSGFDNNDLSVPNGTLSAVSSSDGGTTWTATFTPTVNVQDTTNLISLNNSGVKDQAGNDGTGTTNSGNFTIDTVRPNATIVISDPVLGIGETSLVTITFNQAVTDFSNADLTISNGTLSAVTSGDGGITWTATFTPSSNVADTTNQIVLDNSGVQATVSGNVGVGSSVSNNYTVDTERPTATVVVATDHLGVGGSSVVTITFSEAVSGFDLSDLIVDNGTLSGLTTSDNITYTATLSPVGGINQANNHIVLDSRGVTDGAGNAGGGNVSSNAYVIDSLRPTATIVMSDPALLAGQTSQVTITFSEPVIGFDNSDVSVANGTLSNLISSDGGTTWTATFTPTSGVSDISNLITLNNTGVQDLAGNVGIGVTNSANYSVQTLQPTASIVVANPALLAGGDSLVTITFSEAVSGFDNSDLSVANGTLSNVISSDGGITWTATLTPGSNVTDTTNLITLNNSGVQNASGNAGSGSTDSNNYSIDTQRPTATISVANAHLGIGQSTTVTITFSEAVSGFSLADLSVANGTLTNLASVDGGTTWTATLTPTVGVTDATNLVLLDTSGVVDQAGNLGSGIAISNNYAVDADLPSATIVVANPSLTAGQTTTVTITFSEAVTGFDLSDLSVANGTLSNLASSDGGKTWTATLTPTPNLTDASNLISLDNSSYTDLAGNAGSGFANSNNYSVSTVPVAVDPVSQAGDPEFRVSEPAPPPDLPNVPLQPIIFGPPSGDLGSPLVMPPLFEQRTSGGGLPPIGSIFINNGALAPSFIAQVFSTDSGGDGSGSGFLGFGGGDGGMFGSSTLSSLFNQDSGTQSDSLNAFGKHSISSDATQGLRGVFGAPTLGQQLQQLKDNEQRQIHDLTFAFEQAGISEMQA